MNIVVAIDGSPHADRALAWAVDEAEVRAASLTVLHAFNLNRLAGGFDREAAHRRGHDAAADVVREALARVPGGMDIDASIDLPTVRSGDVAAGVLHHTRDADLVVLGSRGHGGFTGLLLGSVSQQVAAHSRIPVAVIPPAHGEAAAITSVIVGVDGSIPSRLAIEWAVDEAEARDVPVHAVHVNRSLASVVADAAAADVAALDDQERKEAHDGLEAILAEQLGTRAAAVTAHVIVGSPSRVLIGHAEQPSSLLVIGSRGRGGFKGMLLGSVSQQCLAHAQAPVVVIHGA